MVEVGESNIKVMDKVHVCKDNKCPAGKAVCCNYCLEQHICQHEVCWDNPQECESCISYEKER